MHRSGLILNRAVSQLFPLMALFSESSGGGGDGGENIIGADDSSLAGDIGCKRSNTGENIGERLQHSANRKDINKDNMNEEDSVMNKTNNYRNGKIKEEEIELKRNYCNGTDQKQNNKETEQVDKKVKRVQKTKATKPLVKKKSMVLFAVEYLTGKL